MATWDSSSSISADMSRHVHIIDDLLGAVLLMAASALVVALELTRRQICAVYQLAFALCVSWLFFIVGGLVDHHVSDNQLGLALFGSYNSTTSYVYVPVAVACVTSMVFVLQLSWCTGCDCCCIVGEPSSSISHKPCFDARIRAHVSLYAACFVSLFIAIGTRLNVRLRGSAINPMGGTLHWTMLRSPYFVSVIHISTLLLLALKLFLQHADRKPFDAGDFHPIQHMAPATTSLEKSSLKTTMQDQERPQPKKKTTARGSLEPKSALTRSPSLPSASSPATNATETRFDNKHSSEAPHQRAQLHKRPASSQSLLDDNDDGDVSALISSDSENDEEILVPSFKTTGSTAHLPPTHQQQPFNTKTIRKRTSRSSSSGYSSSPPSSPISTSSSSSAFSFSSLASGPSISRQHLQHQRMMQGPASRPRSTSSLSSASTSNLMSISDTEDPASNAISAGLDYYSDRPSSASTSIGSYGLRRRAPAQVLTLHHPPAAVDSRENEWLECFDAVSGSVYLYNQRTGESRWKR